MVGNSEVRRSFCALPRCRDLCRRPSHPDEHRCGVKLALRTDAHRLRV